MAPNRGPAGGAFSAGDYYEPYQGRLVLLLATRAARIRHADPPLTDHALPNGQRILAGVAEERDLERVRTALGHVARGTEGITLLHPYDEGCVPEVLGNWLSILEKETSPASPHSEYVGLEVADHWPLFLGFLRPELLLWQSLADLTQAPPATHHRDALQEALETGSAIVSHVESRVRQGRQTSALVVDALCDFARRAMIYEKGLALRSLRNALDPAAQG